MSKGRSVARFQNPFEKLETKEEEQEATEGKKEKEEDTNVVEQESTEEKETPQPDPVDQDEEEEESFITRFKKKKQKPTMEETHTRRTFFVRNDLDEKLKQLYKEYGHGFYTDFITEAIENQLKVIEEEEARMKKK